MKHQLVTLVLSSVALLLVPNTQAQGSSSLVWATTDCSQCEETNADCKAACSVDCGICQEAEQIAAWLAPKCTSQCSPATLPPKCNCAVARPLVEPCLSYCSGVVPLTPPVTTTKPNATASDEYAATDFGLDKANTTTHDASAAGDYSVVGGNNTETVGGDYSSSSGGLNSTVVPTPVPVSNSATGTGDYSDDGKLLPPVVAQPPLIVVSCADLCAGEANCLQMCKDEPATAVSTPLTPSPTSRDAYAPSDATVARARSEMPTPAPTSVTRAPGSSAPGPQPSMVDIEDEYVTDYSFDVRPAGDAPFPAMTAKRRDCHA